MKVGDCAQAIIRARKAWNRTGIMLQAGAQYQLHARGRWTDFLIPHGPAGDPSTSAYQRLFEGRRRIPNANWFALIGAIDVDPSSCFIIGEHALHTIISSGELTCFANDVRGFYWNNCGHVLLEIERVN